MRSLRDLQSSFLFYISFSYLNTCYHEASDYFRRYVSYTSIIQLMAGCRLCSAALYTNWLYQG